MLTIGITGPTGAGKTTALRVLEEMGGRVVDCDAVYHRLLETDGELLGRIEAAFPGVVKDWVLDRKALGARVYADPAALERLTQITWPAVCREVGRALKKGDAASRGPSSVSASGAAAFPPGGRLCGEGLFVIDAIGLFESGLAQLCDLTAAVVADEEVRVRRLMARDGITEDYARARIAAQKPAEWFAERADLVLENNGSEAEFAERCRREFARRCFMRKDDRGAPQPLRKGELMQDYTFVDLAERPELEQQAAAWFHDKWGVPEEAYLECMDAYLAGETELGWYLCLHGDQIVGGLGVIENDFHDRKDLTPNVCAVFTEPEHRGRGIAGRLLNMAVEELRKKGISPVYLVTDHTSFYERYGWEFFCHAQGDGEEEPTRLYIHR